MKQLMQIPTIKCAYFVPEMLSGTPARKARRPDGILMLINNEYDKFH